MSGRPTADIVADIDKLSSDPCTWSEFLAHEAADRLGELGPELEATAKWNGLLLADIAERDALRPPCPTCGGKGTTTTNRWAGSTPIPCPDCVDGRVPFERLVAVFNAVFADLTWHEHEGIPTVTAINVRNYLQGIR